MAKKRSSKISRSMTIITGEASRTNETEEDADIVEPLEIDDQDEIDQPQIEVKPFDYASYQQLEKNKSTLGMDEAFESKIRKLANVSELHTRTFQQRLKNVDKDVRPVVKALLKEPLERMGHEIQTTCEYFSEIRCFKDLKISQHDLIRLVQETKCEFVPKNEVLFRLGDRGYTFYICLSGSC